MPPQTCDPPFYSLRFYSLSVCRQGQKFFMTMPFQPGLSAIPTVNVTHDLDEVIPSPLTVS